MIFKNDAQRRAMFAKLSCVNCSFSNRFSLAETPFDAMSSGISNRADGDDIRFSLKDDVRKIVALGEFDINPYAQSYIDALDEADLMGGETAVRAQALYIASNLTPMNDNQEKVLDQLLSVGYNKPYTSKLDNDVISEVALERLVGAFMEFSENKFDQSGKIGIDTFRDFAEKRGVPLEVALISNDWTDDYLTEEAAAAIKNAWKTAKVEGVTYDKSNNNVAFKGEFLTLPGLQKIEDNDNEMVVSDILSSVNTVDKSNDKMVSDLLSSYESDDKSYLYDTSSGSLGRLRSDGDVVSIMNVGFNVDDSQIPSNNIFDVGTANLTYDDIYLEPKNLNEIDYMRVGPTIRPSEKTRAEVRSINFLKEGVKLAGGDTAPIDANFLAKYRAELETAIGKQKDAAFNALESQKEDNHRKFLKQYTRLKENRNLGNTDKSFIEEPKYEYIYGDVIDHDNLDEKSRIMMENLQDKYSFLEEPESSESKLRDSGFISANDVVKEVKRPRLNK